MCNTFANRPQTLLKHLQMLTYALKIESSVLETSTNSTYTHKRYQNVFKSPYMLQIRSQILPKRLQNIQTDLPKTFFLFFKILKFKNVRLELCIYSGYTQIFMPITQRIKKFFFEKTSTHPLLTGGTTLLKFEKSRYLLIGAS